MSKHIFSTMGADVAYPVIGRKRADESYDIDKVIVVKGGAHVISKNLITPLGVHTHISDADFELLAQNDLFKFHCEGGHIQVNTSDADPEKVARDMAGADGTAQLTDADFEDSDTGAPVTSDDNEPAKRGRGRPRKE